MLPEALPTLHVTLPEGLLAIYTEEVKVKEPRQKKGSKRRDDDAPTASEPQSA